MKIRKVNHGKKPSDKNSYCGPAVISSLTGCTTAQAAQILREVSGKTMIKGTTNRQMINALSKFNFDVLSMKFTKGIKLGAWLRATENMRQDLSKAYLLAVDHHWILIQGNKYVCGIIKNVVSVKNENIKIGGVVESVYEVSTQHMFHPKDVIKKKEAPSKYYARCRSLIKKFPDLHLDSEVYLGVGSEPTYTKYWIGCDKIECSDLDIDPYESHFVDSDEFNTRAQLWEEIYERLKTYADILVEQKLV